MAKRSFRGKPKKAKKPSQSNLMSQMAAMQEQMKAAQSNLENEYTTVTAGGGAIKIVISGHQRIKSIKLDPELLDPDDVEMVQDMLVAGINKAIEESQTMAAGQMEGITGGLGLDGLGLGDMLGGLGM